MTPCKIADLALIGDCLSAALVARTGAIEWLCWPRFDSPPLFGRLLDPEGGHFTIAPATEYRSTRRYVPDTNVLETRSCAAHGEVVLVDAMPIFPSEQAMVPEHEILRRATCTRGEVLLDVHFDPRNGWSKRRVVMEHHGRLGLRGLAQDGLVSLTTNAVLAPEPAGGARGRMRLHAGQHIDFSLTYTQEAPSVLPQMGGALASAIARTCALWRRFAAGARYEGAYREAVVRSALTLKLLEYAPSGAIVAAPTTSLPERIGGDLNWDYRYCWLRDASFTARALVGLGLHDEADAFVSWLLHTTRLTSPALRVLYDLFGDHPPRERTFPTWRGFADSQPVRVGNAAHDQVQLDVYGEVIEAAALLARPGCRFDRDTSRLLRDLGRYVCHRYLDPDEGIWEPRTGRRLHTHSLLLCWTGLQRLLTLGRRGALSVQLPVARFASVRDRIVAYLHTCAYDDRAGSYTQVPGVPDLDATSLLMSWYGFEPGNSPRMCSTVAHVRQRLGTPDGLLYRYRTGESRGEGAFMLCSFWLVEALARGGGDPILARPLFERLLALGNDVGLYGEEVEPATGAPLGNFPQGFRTSA
jgi:GH15 family glucan-1,4-alpha-glucosidase